MTGLMKFGIAAASVLVVAAAATTVPAASAKGAPDVPLAPQQKPKPKPKPPAPKPNLLREELDDIAGALDRAHNELGGRSLAVKEGFERSTNLVWEGAFDACIERVNWPPPETEEEARSREAFEAAWKKAYFAVEAAIEDNVLAGQIHSMFKIVEGLERHLARLAKIQSLPGKKFQALAARARRLKRAITLMRDAVELYAYAAAEERDAYMRLGDWDCLTAGNNHANHLRGMKEAAGKLTQAKALIR